MLPMYLHSDKTGMLHYSSTLVSISGFGYVFAFQTSTLHLMKLSTSAVGGIPSVLNATAGAHCPVTLLLMIDR